MELGLWLVKFPLELKVFEQPLLAMLFMYQVRFLISNSLFYLFIVGGHDGLVYTDTIMKFNNNSEEWEMWGSMMSARKDHAVSIINVEDVIDNCT